jgi:hypothetical protein
MRQTVVFLPVIDMFRPPCLLEAIGVFPGSSSLCGKRPPAKSDEAQPHCAASF